MIAVPGSSARITRAACRPSVACAGGIRHRDAALGHARNPVMVLLACYAMFGLSLIASLVVITQLWRRLVRYGPGPAAMVPTVWIVLGPLGQSITAANLLGEAAQA